MTRLAQHWGASEGVVWWIGLWWDFCWCYPCWPNQTATRQHSHLAAALEGSSYSMRWEPFYPAILIWFSNRCLTLHCSGVAFEVASYSKDSVASEHAWSPIIPFMPQLIDETPGCPQVRVDSPLMPSQVKAFRAGKLWVLVCAPNGDAGSLGAWEPQAQQLYWEEISFKAMPQICPNLGRRYRLDGPWRGFQRCTGQG